MGALKRLAERYKAVKNIMETLFALPDDQYFDKNFTEVIRQNQKEKAINTIKSLKVLQKFSADIKTALISLKVLLNLKKFLQVIFEAELFENRKSYEDQCRRLISFFSKIHIKNSENNDFVPVTNLLKFARKNDINPIILTIVVPYVIWDFCRLFSIRSRSKFLAFINVINGCILLYVNSLGVYFDILEIIRNNIVFNLHEDRSLRE